MLLSLLGGVLGVFVAAWGVGILSAILPGTIPMAEAGAEIVRPPINVDARALVFALVISTGAALIFGLLPALYVAAADVERGVEGRGPNLFGIGFGRTQVWRFLVAGEVALATMLLIGAGLAMKSFVNLQHVNPGIRPDHVLTFRMRLPTDNLYKSDHEASRFLPACTRQSRPIARHSIRRPYRCASARAAERPGVLHHRKPPRTAGADPGCRLSACVSPRYFNTMGIALLEGRLLSDRDVRSAPPVILIDETLARQYWPNQNPIRPRRMRLWGEFREVVGIVSQVHHYGLEKQPSAYHLCILRANAEQTNGAGGAHDA